MRRRLAAALALLLALGTVAAACGDDDDTPAPAAPTTTGTTTGGEGDGPALPTVPADYVAELVEAWESGDVEAAHVDATDEAVDALFAFEPGGPGTWLLEGCEGAAGSSYCTFRAGGDPTVVVRVGNEAAAAGSPQAVTEVRVQP